MTAPIEPRVRFQAQFLRSDNNEWWDILDPSISFESAESDDSLYNHRKTRILKTTTTFEVVEEMEPKS